MTRTICSHAIVHCLGKRSNDPRVDNWYHHVDDLCSPDDRFDQRRVAGAIHEGELQLVVSRTCGDTSMGWSVAACLPTSIWAAGRLTAQSLRNLRHER